MILSASVMLVLHICRADGVPIEAMRMNWSPVLLLALAAVILISNTYCWILRTKIVQNANMTIVSIAMPLSAVITMVLSVIAGTDTLSVQLILGAVIIAGALILSAVGEQLEEKKTKTPETAAQK